MDIPVQLDLRALTAAATRLAIEFDALLAEGLKPAEKWKKLEAFYYGHTNKVERAIIRSLAFEHLSRLGGRHE